MHLHAHAVQHGRQGVSRSGEHGRGGGEGCENAAENLINRYEKCLCVGGGRTSCLDKLAPVRDDTWHVVTKSCLAGVEVGSGRLQKEPGTPP